MPYVATIVVAIMLIVAVPAFSRGEFKDNSTPYPEELYAMCFDGVDNDGDGFTDQNDPDCPRCFDGIDNDGDGLIDEADPDCPFSNSDSLAGLGEQVVDNDSGFQNAGNGGFSSGDDITYSNNGTFSSNGIYTTQGFQSNDPSRDRMVSTGLPVPGPAIYRSTGIYTQQGYRSY